MATATARVDSDIEPNIGSGLAWRSKKLARNPHLRIPGMTNVALIADDDEFFRVALKNILLDQFAFDEIIETASFDEAMERLPQRHDISLALFDLAMAGMASAASLKAVRECFPEIRVAVVSASNRREDIILALEAGVHGFVPKGLGIELLVDALNLIVDGMIYVPPSLADVDAAATEPPPCAARAPDRMSVFTPRQKMFSN